MKSDKSKHSKTLKKTKALERKIERALKKALGYERLFAVVSLALGLFTAHAISPARPNA
jgi:hypothetical protein